MCRRVIQPIVTTHLAVQLNLPPDGIALEHDKERNSQPGQRLLTVRRRNPESPTNRAAYMRWGIGTAQRGRDLIYNARAETAGTKPTFREAYRNRRCLVPIAGFYEFPKNAPPVTFRTTAETPAAMAAIWSPATRHSYNPKHCAVLTAEPNATVAPHHHRMPVILMEEEWQEWMDITTPTSRLAELTRPKEWETITISLR